jgi:mannose-6-phosphate isomerase-like protein (cupin superfamily)
MVTLVHQPSKPSLDVGHGIVFMYAVAGEAIYQYGQNEFLLNTGDSLSIDAEMSFGFKQILSTEFTFLSVQAK